MKTTKKFKVAKEGMSHDHHLDEGIYDAVVLLNKHGFDTWESCQGGDGHCFPEPTVRFWGTEFDLIRAYELCYIQGMNVFAAKRVYWKVPVYSDVTGVDGNEIGENWDKPFNELEFRIHRDTGTIYRLNAKQND